jgi:hypothetical protein
VLSTLPPECKAISVCLTAGQLKARVPQRVKDFTFEWSISMATVQIVESEEKVAALENRFESFSDFVFKPSIVGCFL